MALSSMTGFARGHGVSGPYAWSWEIKSVNAKGLDLRLLLPPGWDPIEWPGRREEIGARGGPAEAAPGRRPEAIKARLAEQIETLLSASTRFDSDRLHQEAIMIATKADIREELDRLDSHVAQVRKMLADGGPVGRRLDFLAQELNRESNTLTAKANELELS